MPINLPGSIGFNLSSYLGKILRAGLKLVGVTGDGDALTQRLEQRFPLAEPGWITTTTGWITQGRGAIQNLVSTGKITQDVLMSMPVVPPSVFPIQPGDRVIITGDLVASSLGGEELFRRLTTIGTIENEYADKIFSRQLQEQIIKIHETNPQEAYEIVESIFEAHWAGRIF